MEITAITKKGVLIEATLAEVGSIINSVTGKKPDKIEIGQRIPAIDYAQTIYKIKSLNDNYEYRQLKQKANQFSEALEELSEVITAAADIEV